MDNTRKIDKNDPNLTASRMMLDRLIVLYTKNKDLYEDFEITQLVETDEALNYLYHFKKIEGYLGMALNSYRDAWIKSIRHLLVLTLFILKGVVVDTTKSKDNEDPDNEDSPSIRDYFDDFLEDILINAIHLIFFKHYVKAISEVINSKYFHLLIDLIDEDITSLRGAVKSYNKALDKKNFKCSPKLEFKKEMYKKDYDRLVKKMTDLDYLIQPYYNIEQEFWKTINISLKGGEDEK